MKIPISLFIMHHVLICLDGFCVLSIVCFYPPTFFKRRSTQLFWEIQYEISITEFVAFSKMGLCFKYLTIFLKTAKLEKLKHFYHNNERLYVLIMLKRLMTGMIWGTHVGPVFLTWVVLIKNI